MTPEPHLPRYRVQFVTGDYSARQAEANRIGAALYIEGHANSSANIAADYAMCVVSTNASKTSKHLAAWLALAWGTALDVGGDRDSDIGYGNGYRVGGAGDSNLRYTDMPAVLCEPCFASNRTQALACESPNGLELVASILVEGIRDMLPSGSLIAFSIGHLGKTSAPYDRGARWRGKRFGTEADFASAYLHCASEMLRNGSLTSTARTLRALRLVPAA